jgi:hypothetical protein
MGLNFKVSLSKLKKIIKILTNVKNVGRLLNLR